MRSTSKNLILNHKDETAVAPPSLKSLASEIEQIKKQQWEGAVAVRQSALRACNAAISIGSPLLEGEALLLLGRNFTPAVFPEEVFKAMVRARAIFLENNLPASAAHSRVIASRALLDMGRDRAAIALVRLALAEEALTHEHRAAAFVIMAICHGHLGEIDIALRFLSREAIPLLGTRGGALHRPQVMRAAAALHTQVLLSQITPSYWRGVPNLPDFRAPPPRISDILSFVREAKAALPPGKDWPMLELTEHVAVWCAEESERPIEALRRLATSNAESDPASSCWALFCASVLLQHRKSFDEALALLVKAQHLASVWKLTLVTSDVLLQKARIYEQLGDTKNSLHAYKAFWAVRDSTLHRAQPSHTDQDPDSAVCAKLGHATSLHRLRSLKPAHVRRALAFIDQQLGDKLTVSLIAGHCAVNRRTLEIAFRETMNTSIAQYIKRQRLERAATSLRNTSCSIKEVSRSVGYLSAAGFGRDFLALFGVQPAKWRRRASPISDGGSTEQFD